MPVFAGGGEVRRVEHNDEGRHRRMDIAEYPHDTGVREMNRPACSRWIKREVEDLAVEARKGVVKDRVQVGKLDGGADIDRKNMWIEPFILLDHAHML